MKLFNSFVASAFAMHVSYSIVININPIEIEKRIDATKDTSAYTVNTECKTESSSLGSEDRTRTNDTVSADKRSLTSSSVFSAIQSTRISHDFEPDGGGTESYTKLNASRHLFTYDGDGNTSTSTGTIMKIPPKIARISSSVDSRSEFHIGPSRSKQLTENRSGDSLIENFFKNYDSGDDEIEKTLNRTYTTVSSWNACQDVGEETKQIPPACTELALNATESTTKAIAEPPPSEILASTTWLIDKTNESTRISSPTQVDDDSPVPIVTSLVETTLTDRLAETIFHTDGIQPSSTTEPITYESCRSAKSSNRSLALDRLCRKLGRAWRNEMRRRCDNDTECLRRYGLRPSYVPESVRRVTVSSRNPDASKNLTAVRPLKGNVSSNAGFLMANRKHGTRLFFWFVRSSRLDHRQAPIVVWLQGQPGWSSLYSFFEEHGPYRVVETSSDGSIRFKIRKSAWTSEFNVLYLDHCVGCGFSLSLSRADYKPTYKTVGNNVQRALSEFYSVWSEYADNDLYLAGEHGCAKYIPVIAHAIHQSNSFKSTNMNLKGLLIGGPYADATSMAAFSDYLYTVGLIDENEQNTLSTQEEYAKALIRASRYDEAIRFLQAHTYSKFDQAGYRKLYDLRYAKPKYGFYRFESYMPKVMADKRLIRSIHAEGLQFRKRSLRILTEDIMGPVDKILTNVLKNYKICYYNGQFDMLTPYSLTATYFSKLNWIRTDSFFTSDLNNWYATSEQYPDGYWKYSNNLTHVLIRDAGHTVGTTKPKTLLFLLKWFVEGKFEKSYTPPSPDQRYLNVFE